MYKKTPNPNSILGLTLLGASAIVATFYSSRAASLRESSVDNGRALQFRGGDYANQAILTCVGASTPFDCHLTAGTGTTAISGVHTFVIDGLGNFYQTHGNSSASIITNGVDTTSILVRIQAKTNTP